AVGCQDLRPETGSRLAALTRVCLGLRSIARDALIAPLSRRTLGVLPTGDTETRRIEARVARLGIGTARTPATIAGDASGRRGALAAADAYSLRLPPLPLLAQLALTGALMAFA